MCGETINMKILIILAIFYTWYFIGFSGLYYAFKKNFLPSVTLGEGVVFSLIGPLMWLCIFLAHPFWKQPLFKRKK